eukprot:COSAG02_NODE_888_length_16167_cov_293.783234_4_plen_178_part_00
MRAGSYIVLAVIAQQDTGVKPNPRFGIPGQMRIPRRYCKLENALRLFFAGKESEPSFHFPFFTLLDVVVYMGALRVGQLFENPLASDDDDCMIPHLTMLGFVGGADFACPPLASLIYRPQLSIVAPLTCDYCPNVSVWLADEIVAFFNRNLRIAHIYGLYGDPNANRSSSEGAVEIG